MADTRCSPSISRPRLRRQDISAQLAAYHNRIQIEAGQSRGTWGIIHAARYARISVSDFPVTARAASSKISCVTYVSRSEAESVSNRYHGSEWMIYSLYSEEEISFINISFEKRSRRMDYIASGRASKNSDSKSISGFRRRASLSGSSGRRVYHADGIRRRVKRATFLRVPVKRDLATP